MSGYLDCSGREDRLSGGARMIPVATPVGQYQVWVKRVGSNPGLRVLLLHGGPGAAGGSRAVGDWASSYARVAVAGAGDALLVVGGLMGGLL